MTMTERERKSLLRFLDLLDKIDFDNLQGWALLLIGMCAQDVRDAFHLDRDVDDLIKRRALHVGITKIDFMTIIEEISKEQTA